MQHIYIHLHLNIIHTYVYQRGAHGLNSRGTYDEEVEATEATVEAMEVGAPLSVAPTHLCVMCIHVYMYMSI